MRDADMKILMLEDSASDAELAERALRRAELRFTMRRVDSENEFFKALSEFRPDVVVTDYSLPGFDGLRALEIVRRLTPDVPVIIFSGSLGDERAVEALKMGATDYVLKDRMQRLPAAITRAHQEALDLRARRRIDASLRYRLEFEEIITSFCTDFIHFDAEQIGEGIRRALRRIGEFVGVDRSFAFVLSADAKRIAETHEWCRSGVMPRIDTLRGLPLEAFLWGATPPEDGIIHIPRVLEADGVSPRPGTRSLLAVRIALNQTVIGFVGFENARVEYEWNEETISLLMIVASIFGNAIDRRRFEIELRREKEFNANIIETTETLVAVLTETGRFVRVNEAFCRLTGLDGQKVIGRSIWSVGLPAASESGIRELIEQALATGSARGEIALPARALEARSILWQGGLARDAAGSPEFIVLTGTDLTEMRGLESRLEQARRVDSLGRVAATVAHEFNNVLMAISPLTELLRRQSGDAAAVERVADRISKAIRRGEGITKEVTRFARPSESALQRFDLREWIETIADEIRVTLGDRVELVVQAAGESFPVFADRGQLEQVIANIAANARDAMPNGGRLTIRIDRVSEADGEHVRLSIRDSGEGIPQDVLPRIFEPLFTTKRTGTGLGLAASREIITAHRGRMSVESEIGHGTVFYIQIPLALRAA